MRSCDRWNKTHAINLSTADRYWRGVPTEIRAPISVGTVGNFSRHVFRSYNFNLNQPQLTGKSRLRACLHGGGGPQVGDVTRLGGVTRLSM